MAHNLTNPITLTNASRLVVTRPEAIDDDQEQILIPIELRTGAGNNIAIARVFVVIRNGKSDRLIRSSTQTGVEAGALLAVDTGAITTPTGFDQVWAAYKGAAGPAAARVAVEGVLRTLQVIDPVSLAGS